MAAKSSTPRQQKHLAVLIDADNASVENCTWQIK
jgi:hypothetical protein